jgi:MoaA/NifB/PqqE/SkfB family radical SAM enzyme
VRCTGFKTNIYIKEQRIKALVREKIMNTTSITRYKKANPLDNSLKVFFSNACRITLRHPSQAYFFLRTVLWQRKAARTRTEYNGHGVMVPPIIIYSITDRCNLHCKGCYAQALHTSLRPELSPAKMRDTIRQARELGVSFMVLAGGEPMVRHEILDYIQEFPDVIFFVFTNGTLIDEALASRIQKIHNIVPIISLEGRLEDTDGRRGEGVYRRLTGAMQRLKNKGIFFGTSITLTRSNFSTVTDKNFIEGLNHTGCRMFFFVEYSPVDESTEDWVISEAQRDDLSRTMKAARSHYAALFISVPGDEKEFGGCLSAGRGFVHINAQGDVEPCPFAPYSDTNVRDLSLKEALQSEFLAEVRSNSGRFEENAGGCALWKQREQLEVLLEKEQQENRIPELVGQRV